MKSCDDSQHYAVHKLLERQGLTGMLEEYRGQKSPQSGGCLQAIKYPQKMIQSQVVEPMLELEDTGRNHAVRTHDIKTEILDR